MYRWEILIFYTTMEGARRSHHVGGVHATDGNAAMDRALSIAPHWVRTHWQSMEAARPIRVMEGFTAYQAFENTTKRQNIAAA